MTNDILIEKDRKISRLELQINQLIEAGDLMAAEIQKPIWPPSYAATRIYTGNWTSVCNEIRESVETHHVAEEIERLRDEVARERLARRDAEKWLNQIKEIMLPYWQHRRSNWDGSLSGLPTEMQYVVEEFKWLQIRLAELDTENYRLRRTENSSGTLDINTI